jgi:hypothetical protein
MHMSQTNNEQTELLREILKWIKFSAMKDVSPILTSRLDTDAKKSIYQLSDGTKSAVEIAEAIKQVSSRQITRYWLEWLKPPSLGQALTSGRGYRFKRSFDLAEFGLEAEEGGLEDKASSATEQGQTLDEGAVQPDVEQ